LPRIRKRVERDLRAHGLVRRKLLATIVRLLETTLIRIGNEEYSRQNGSFGLTTIRDRHVHVNGSSIRFEFRGKGGLKHAVDFHDRRLARILSRCQELPGEELFQYIDDRGDRHRIASDDVNDYLREITGQDFTAKDFRTWAGTLLAAQALTLCNEAPPTKKAVVQAIESVAQRLRNTRAICRKCYIHPDVIDAYLDGSLVMSLATRTHTGNNSSTCRLNPEEAALVAFLQRRK
jgi:DNA topoisomerase-1